MPSLIRQFLSLESASGLLLIAAATVAILMANSPAASFYTTLQTLPLFSQTFTYWVNDALMALFFLLVGLELKREFISGTLATWPQRLLPGLCALGGMVVPALIYIYLNPSAPTFHGWAIPTATDIAFALGILTLFPRAPLSLKVFLTALAIIDDLGAILLIAVFYTETIAPTPLLLASILTASLITFNRCHVRSLWPYLATGALLWLCIYQSGLHAVLAGVILALTIPTPNPLHRLEHRLHPPVAYAILPLFGFLNAGIPLTGLSWDSFTHPVTLGIFTGLFLGKQLGVGAAMVIGAYLFRAPRPAGTTFAHLYATTLLCGIGFTMSLFIGNLALPESFAPHVRLGILAASLVSAVGAIIILALTTRPRPAHISNNT